MHNEYREIEFYDPEPATAVEGGEDEAAHEPPAPAEPAPVPDAASRAGLPPATASPGPAPVQWLGLAEPDDREPATAPSARGLLVDGWAGADWLR